MQRHSSTTVHCSCWSECRIDLVVHVCVATVLCEVPECHRGARRRQRREALRLCHCAVHRSCDLRLHVLCPSLSSLFFFFFCTCSCNCSCCLRLQIVSAFGFFHFAVIVFWSAHPNLPVCVLSCCCAAVLLCLLWCMHSLDNNGIGADGAAAIAEALKSDATLSAIRYAQL